MRNKQVFLVLLVVVLSLVSTVVIAGVGYYVYTNRDSNEPSVGTGKLKYAKSCDALVDDFEDFQSKARGGEYNVSEDAGAPQPTAPGRDGAESDGDSPDYFTDTNVQVEGIDEGDIIKTDGKRLFSLDTQNREINLLTIFPTATAEKVGEIKLGTDKTPIEMFLQGDNLVVFVSYYPQYGYDGPIVEDGNTEPDRNDRDILPYPRQSQAIQTIVYDVSDMKDPEVVRRTDVEGTFVTTRMKDGYVYLVSNKYLSTYDDPGIPLFREFGIDDKYRRSADCEEIAYLDDSYIYPQYTTVTAMDLGDLNAAVEVNNFVGNTQTVYMSHENIYLATTHYDYNRFWTTDSESTILNKLSYDGQEFDYVNSAKFKGRLLNQFSMDEKDGHLRVAGTLGNNFGTTSENYLIIFDQDMEDVSLIRDLARGESIYAVRFYGDVGVVVTFKKVDPLFVFDLSDPTNPKLEGELKIPGYSNYLHFIDENTVIGLGKDAVEPTDSRSIFGSDFAWYQGLKLGVFDISDLENPKELSSLIIGDRGSESPALNNHKAFVYDSRHKLIIFPASVAEVDQKKCTEQGFFQDPKSCYGDVVSQGAQVIELGLNNKLRLRGEVTHFGRSEEVNAYSSLAVQRTLVVDDVLVTISNSRVKLSEIDDLKDIETIQVSDVSNSPGDYIIF